MDKVLDILLNRKLIYTIIIIIVAVVLYLILSSLINKLVKVKLKGVRIDERRHKTTLSLLKNLVKYFIAIIALLMIMDTYGIDTKSLIASLGVVSLVAGLALQDFLKDIIAGITIIFEDQYAVGDVVTIGEFKGTVNYLGIKSTRIKSFTGETLIIANRNIDKVINHSLEDSTSFMDMPIAYDTDIDKAKEVLELVCKELTEELNLITPAIVCGVQNLGDSSVGIRISFCCKFANKVIYERIFRERVKKSFDENGIEIPFQQVVVHNGK